MFWLNHEALYPKYNLAISSVFKIGNPRSTISFIFLSFHISLAAQLNHLPATSYKTAPAPLTSQESADHGFQNLHCI